MHATLYVCVDIYIYIYIYVPTDIYIYTVYRISFYDTKTLGFPLISRTEGIACTYVLAISSGVPSVGGALPMTKGKQSR